MTNQKIENNRRMDAAIFDGIGILFFAVAFLAIWHRASYGVDVTDESYWVADPYLVVKGAVPFADLWVQTPGTSILIAPFIALYLALTGGTAGIMLYMMRVAVVFRAAISLAVWQLLKKHFGNTAAWASALVLLCANAGYCKGINYNVLSVYLLILGGGLLFCAMRESNAKISMRYYILAGIVMALCTLAHSTQILNCIYFVFFLFFAEHRKYRRIPFWLIYILSGLAIAAIVLLGLEIAGQGGVFSGIKIMLQNNNYFKIPRMPFSEHMRRSAQIALILGKAWLVAFLACMVGMPILVWKFKHALMDHFRMCFTLSVLTAAAFLILYCFLRAPNGYRVVFILFLTAPLLILTMKEEERRANVALFFFAGYRL